MKNIYHIILLTIILTTGSSCKKNKQEPTPPDCRITKVTQGEQVNVISYDTDGRVQSIVSNGTYVNTFEYSGNTIVITTTDRGTFEERKIITLNANRMASNIRRQTNDAGTNWSNNAYEYNGTQLVKRTFTSSIGSTWTGTYTWENGNMVTMVEQGNEVQLEYDLSKSARFGDYYSITAFLQYGDAHILYRNSNLLVSTVRTSGGTTFITSFDYHADEWGNITSMTSIAGGSPVSTAAIEYECR